MFGHISTLKETGSLWQHFLYVCPTKSGDKCFDRWLPWFSLTAEQRGFGFLIWVSGSEERLLKWAVVLRVEWVQNNVNGSSEVEICCNMCHILLLFPMPSFCFTCHPQILLLSSLFQLFTSLFPFFFCLSPTCSLSYRAHSDLWMGMWEGALRCSFVLFYAHFNPWRLGGSQRRKCVDAFSLRTLRREGM